MHRMRNSLKTLGLLSKQHAANTPIRHISFVMHMEFHEIFLEHLSLPKNAEIEDVKRLLCIKTTMLLQKVFQLMWQQKLLD